MNPLRVAVIYHSVTGKTAQLADAVGEGVDEVQPEAAMQYALRGEDIEQGRYQNLALLEAVSGADALIFGSPTFMGCVSAQFKAFADATSELWVEQRWRGKIAAGFTIGSNYSGDQLNTLQYMNIFANQHGMLWAGIDIPGGYDAEGRNRLGAQSGLVAHDAGGRVHEVDLVTARYLGQRVAKLALAVRAC